MTDTQPVAKPITQPAAEPGASSAADRVADRLLRATLDTHPIEASLLGFRDREDRLPDHSAAGEAAFVTRLAEIDAAAAELTAAGGLTEQERITLAVVRHSTAGERDRLAVREAEFTIAGSLFSPAFRLLGALPQVPLTEPSHAEGYLSRLAGIPAVLGHLTERHRAGLATGRLPVRRLVEGAVAQCDRWLADPAADPLRGPEPPVTEAELAAYRQERDRLLEREVRPALARYREVLAAEVAPAARSDSRPGLGWLPGGEDDYRALIRYHTTTDRSAVELHEIGLAAIAELSAEYARLGQRVFGTGDVPTVLRRLRNDPALRWRDGTELLEHARATISRAEAVAPAWFGRLPEQRCAVVAVPESEAPGAPAAYYFPPALDGSRPGTYFANTFQADLRGRAGYEAIAFHEGVPGHHFQIALAQELTDLPPLRRLISPTAYGEGWGLYAERLADEMGLYTDDIAQLGRLSEESMRAARLVVDTGLHAMGWDRRRVVDFLLANTATPEVEIEQEADRYIAAPGQALAYLVGRLEIERLRSEAAAGLGAAFDLRAFHDQVLGHGALPLGVLAEVIVRWAGRAATD